MSGRNGKPARDRTPTPRRGKPSDEWRTLFLEGMRSTFNVEYAVKIAGVSKDTAYRERRKDPEFKKAWDEARETGLDTLRPLLEENNLRLAIYGQEEDVWFQGEVVGKRIVRFPVLAMFFLERLMSARYFVKPKEVAAPDAQQFAALVHALIAQGGKSVTAPPAEETKAEVAA